ncbi:histidine/lysine/arginine/ornithine ABC transporter permease HisM [Pseudomonas aeruginosa]|nr:histidine/lysine/arginine/ornithine ABC transporter permease HisM [Pseudomonas aeruginosa]
MNAVLDEYWQAYLWTDGLQLTGLAMTLWLLILAVALGFLLAIPLAVARTCGKPAAALPVWLYTYVFRGTPLYIQLLFFYTGVYSLNAIRAQDFLNAFFRDGFNCTVLAFVLNTCAYMTEIFAGAIRNTPHGEVEAARAYGMGGFTLYRAHRPALGAAPGTAVLQQRSDPDAAFHLGGVHRHSAGPAQGGPRRQFRHLCAVPVLRHRRRALRPAPPSC